MNKRIAILILVVIAVGAGALILSRGGEPETDLVRVWQLVPEGRYRGTAVTDPFVSWSPDSRSLLLGGLSTITQQEKVFGWKVGDKALQLVTRGASPNYFDKDTFLYLRANPKSIMKRRLSTGAESEALSSVKKSGFWDDVTGFSYDPAKQTIILRITPFTDRYFPGTEQYDLSGKQLPDYVPDMCEGSVECSRSPKGDKWAIVLQPRENAPATLEIAPAGKPRGKPVAQGRITAVAWSPKGDVVAYGEGTSVIAVRPSDGRSVVVARFQGPKTQDETRFLGRLSWSPNGKYLAALVYMSALTGDFPIIYVLDMSRLKWD